MLLCLTNVSGQPRGNSTSWFLTDVTGVFLLTKMLDVPLDFHITLCVKLPSSQHKSLPVSGGFNTLWLQENVKTVLQCQSIKLHHSAQSQTRNKAKNLPAKIFECTKLEMSFSCHLFPIICLFLKDFKVEK